MRSMILLTYLPTSLTVLAMAALVVLAVVVDYDEAA